MASRRLRRLRPTLLLLLLLAACGKAPAPRSHNMSDPLARISATLQDQLAFTCSHPHPRRGS